MRITIVGPAYPLRGGIAHHVYSLRRALVERGHSVQVVSFNRLYPRFLFPGKTPVDSSRLKLDAGALPLLDSASPVTWLRAFKAIKAFAPDVVVVEWWHPFFAPLVGILGRLLKKTPARLVVECHNIFPHERTPVDRPLAAFALGPADRFITHSDGDRKDLLALLPGRKVEVAALPSPSEFHKPGTRSRGGRTLLFFGIVRKYKGLDVLLAATAKARARVDCWLIVAGEFYDPVERYRALIDDYGLGEHVALEDLYVPNEEVAELFERADALVLPYLSATQSGVAQIALANSLPIIASRVGGLAEVVADRVNGLLIPPGDPDALAGAIVDYFENGLGPAFAA
ncbi:MAG TPA: glycosyltransferase family 4 protein, partial [Blastocatellia bacterium]|nr:glycosyltransferase family 4 protein [Blastocatellia bacterium]